jgi:hypothetical protein
MKTLIRPSLLIAALALVVFAPAGHSLGQGTCRVFCYDPTTRRFSTVTSDTSKAECCGGDFNPCPAGDTAGAFYYTPPNPPGGSQVACQS